jgi:hypothetical protein
VQQRCARARRLSALTTRQFLWGFADGSLRIRSHFAAARKTQHSALFYAHVSGMSAKLNRVFRTHAAQALAAARDSGWIFARA